MQMCLRKSWSHNFIISSYLAEDNELMITKRGDGYYVLSEKTKKNLGGPYKTRAEAVKRLGQVEFFKHKAKS